MGDLLDGYTPELAWDEMFAGPDEPRSHYESLHEVLGTLSRDDFEARCAARDRAFHDQGITFSHSGEERPFPLAEFASDADASGPRRRGSVE